MFLNGFLCRGFKSYLHNTICFIILYVFRVVGTESHEMVKEFIIARLRKLSWDVDLDEFEADTPIFKNLQFTNIIASINPKAERFLVIADLLSFALRFDNILLL